MNLLNDILFFYYKEKNNTHNKFWMNMWILIWNKQEICKILMFNVI